MTIPSILIVVDGGVVQTIRTDDDVSVMVVDYDEIREGGNIWEFDSLGEPGFFKKAAAEARRAARAIKGQRQRRRALKP